MNISASMIKDVLVCSKRADFRINYPEQAIQTTEQLVGSVVHKVIEDYWRDERAAYEYVNLTNLQGPEKDKCVRMLESFFGNFYYLLNENDLVEKYFRLEIGEDLFLVGKMDRVSVENKMVIDWKTSVSTPFSVANDPQFIIYNYAFRRLFSVPAEFVGFASLTKGRIVKFDYDKQLEEELFSSIIPDVIRIIKTKSFIRQGLFGYNGIGRISGACKNCAHYEMCRREGE